VGAKVSLLKGLRVGRLVVESDQSHGDSTVPHPFAHSPVPSEVEGRERGTG